MFAVLGVFLLTHTAFGAVRIEDISNGGTKNVAVGDNPVIRCISPEGDDLEWVLKSAIGDVTLEDNPPITITALQQNGMTSVLSIDAAEEGDTGEYKCRSSSNPSDFVSFELVVSSAGSLPQDWVTPHIERQSNNQDEIEVEIGNSLRLKCIGGSQGSNLVFEHNGDVITDDDKNTLTTSAQVSSNEQVLILSRIPATSGEYKCKDSSHPGSPDDTIDVVINESPSVHLQIVEPSGSTSKVMAGDDFNIRCEARIGTTIEWFLNDLKLTTEVDGFIIGSSVDTVKQVTSSLLTKEDPTTQDSGDYVCMNADRSDETSQITIEVVTPGGEATGTDEDDDGIFGGLFGGSAVNIPSRLVINVAALITFLWALNW